MANFKSTGSDATGYLRFLSESAMTSVGTVQADTNLLSDLATGTFTAGSRILMQVQVGGLYVESDNNGYGWGNAVGTAWRFARDD